jgi:hypothetical protein
VTKASTGRAAKKLRPPPPRRPSRRRHPPTPPPPKTKNRAERFGVEYVEPARARTDLRLEARRERIAKSGFVTGIDFFSAEEEEKRRRRAAKFGLAPADEGGNGDAAAATGVAALDPDDDPAELARRRARAERFGVPLAPPKPPQQRVGAHDGVMDVDALEAPADPTPDAAPRPEAVYLYGVDLLSTSDCLRYFTEYGPTFVEWLNDSACVVVFADAPSALRAMRGTGVALPPAADEGGAEAQAPPPQQEDAMDGAEAAAEGAAATGGQQQQQWFRGRDFLKSGTAVRLLYRGATQADRRDLTAPKPPSRYLWKTVGGAPVGSKRGRRGGPHDGEGGGGGYNRGGGGGGPHGGGGGGGQQGRRRRRMDGSYEEVDMADADGDGNEMGGGGEEEERWARGRGRGRGGGGDGGGDGGGGEQQEEGWQRPRRVVHARRRNRAGGNGEQQGNQQQQQQRQQQQGDGGGGGGGDPSSRPRRGRGNRMARSFKAREDRVEFLEVE